MKSDVLLDNFVGAVRSRLHKGENLANTLAEMLSLGREAVYRRLRGEVPFTFEDVATVASRMNLSLDEILGRSTRGNSIFYLHKVEFVEPLDWDYHHFETCVEIFKEVSGKAFSETGLATDQLPMSLFYAYRTVADFFYYKWMYQDRKGQNVSKFSAFTLPDKLRRYQREYLLYTRSLSNTFFVLDDRVFANVVKDINYFIKIQLIDKKEAARLKEELLLMIDDLDRMTSKGCFDNGNRLDVYVSGSSLDATYSYCESDDVRFSMVNVFLLNGISSLDTDVFHFVKDWIESLKRVSTLISGTGEIERVKFFRKQKDIIEKLIV